MCLFPKLIPNTRYKGNKKNGGNPPPLPLDKNGKPDKRVMMVPRQCNKCMECMKKKSRDWKVRLEKELEKGEKAMFVNLTFSEESYAKLAISFPKLKGYDLDNAIAKKAVREFNERYRYYHKKALRHFIVSELGSGKTEHLHLHGIVFGSKETPEGLGKIWQYGTSFNSDRTNGGKVDNETIAYIVKYMYKTDELHKSYTPVVLNSPGIGNNFKGQNNKYKNGETIEYIRTTTGHKIAMPTYYRNKVYSDEEKEKLWQEKLDKQIRYVNGNEIDVSKGEEQYKRALKHAQNMNKRLGYGDDGKNWTLKEYEHERRIMLQNEKIERGKVKLRVEPIEDMGKNEIKGGTWESAF